MAESEPTKEELLKRIAELEQQAQAKKPGEPEFRVSEKGGISVYGEGGFACSDLQAGPLLGAALSASTTSFAVGRKIKN